MSHWLLLLGIVSAASAQTFLAVENGELRLNNEKVFLSGMNIAWQNYGNDFGNGQYACCTGSTLEGYLQNIAAAGGNSVRIWIHTDGYSTPQFDGNGFVTGTDGSNTFIPDLSQYLDVAQSNNILVTLVLWNGATAPSTNYRGLLEDNSKLQSYIDNALVPTVNALKGKVALAAWEIMNEPEGIVTAGQTDSNPCFDTTPLSGSGAGWAASFPMSTLLNFINRQIAAIKAEDPKALATIGSWSELAQTDNFGYRNYYTDSCLVAARDLGPSTSSRSILTPGRGPTTPPPLSSSPRVTSACPSPRWWGSSARAAGTAETLPPCTTGATLRATRGPGAGRPTGVERMLTTSTRRPVAWASWPAATIKPKAGPLISTFN